MQVFGIHFSTVHLPIVFLKSNPCLHDAQKERMQFLKIHYTDNLIVTEKSTSITFLLKHDVWSMQVF